jgi:hypothetical protein
MEAPDFRPREVEAPDFESGEAALQAREKKNDKKGL